MLIHYYSRFPFVLLCALLSDPLWFKVLVITTKVHKGYHQGSQRTLSTIPLKDKKFPKFIQFFVALIFSCSGLSVIR